MCLIAWNWQPQSDTPLLVLSNRDEFYARDTLPLHWWPPASSGVSLLAGKDQRAGGTWLGVNNRGWLAALTNFRSPMDMAADAPSRGALVASFLAGIQDARTYLASLQDQAHHYNGFNLLLYDGVELLGFQSRDKAILVQPVGVGAVSNAHFQTPWPKLHKLSQKLQTALQQGQDSDSQLLALLKDPERARDDQLPHTGIGLERERELSPIFITTPHYGTRASSLVRIGRTHLEFTEESYDAQGGCGARYQRHAW